MEYSQKYPDYFNAMAYYESHEMDFSEDTSQASSCEEKGMQVMGLVAGAIQEGIDDGSIKSDLDPMYVATVLQAHYTGLISILTLRGQHLSDKHGLDINKLVDISFVMTERALKK